jgi:hypothetical protein
VRQLEIDPQFLGFGAGRGRLLFDAVEFGAQRLVGCARFIEHAGERLRLRLFLFERRSALLNGATILPKESLSSSSSSILRAVSLKRSRSASFSSPRREPASASLSAGRVRWRACR